MASRVDSHTTSAISLTDSVSLLQKKKKKKSEKWNLKPRLAGECSTSTIKGSCALLPGDLSKSLAGKTNIRNGLRLRRSEVLRSLRHSLRAQGQGHHTIDRLEEKGVDKGRAQRSFLTGRGKAVVNQTNIGTVSQGQHWEDFSQTSCSTHGLS